MLITRLKFKEKISDLDKNNRLLGVVKKFSELDLNPETIDGHKMGYMFEEIIRRFSENAEAGDHYTPREVSMTFCLRILPLASFVARAHSRRLIIIIGMMMSLYLSAL